MVPFPRHPHQGPHRRRVAFGASQISGYDVLSWLQPDIAAHVSGGPIPMSDADIDTVVDSTAFRFEICSSGNDRSTHARRQPDAREGPARRG